MSCTPPYTASLTITATILSSTSLPSSIPRPPIGRACTRMFPCVKSFSVRTRMSSGSSSPTSPGRPVFSSARAATRALQRVRGTKPYGLGQTFE